MRTLLGSGGNWELNTPLSAASKNASCLLRNDCANTGYCFDASSAIRTTRYSIGRRQHTLPQVRPSSDSCQCALAPPLQSVDSFSPQQDVDGGGVFNGAGSVCEGAGQWGAYKWGPLGAAPGNIKASALPISDHSGAPPVFRVGALFWAPPAFHDWSPA